MRRIGFPFHVYSAIGAFALLGLDLLVLAIAPNVLAGCSDANLSTCRGAAPFLCLSCGAVMAIPILMGFFAARSTGFAISGGAAGAGAMAGYNLLQDLLPATLSTLTTEWASAVELMGCSAVIGFVLGIIGGRVGASHYQVWERYTGMWAPRSQDNYGAQPYYGPPLDPQSPYEPPPPYSTSYGPFRSTYDASEYQPPPKYQPGPTTRPTAYPPPGYNPPSEGNGPYGEAPVEEGSRPPNQEDTWRHPYG